MNTYRFRILVLASSLALLSSLGLWATAVEAWWTPPPSSSCGSSTFPATGQTASYPPLLKITDAPVRDDGLVRAGGALSYQNNGDGTITDLNTGLMWEQKIRDSEGLHDVFQAFPWDSATPTIWDWLEEVNAEGGTGLAGYNDWRIPNVKELQSIVDYGKFILAVDPAFNNGPGFNNGPFFPSCSVAECSLTGPGDYWSATSFDISPFNAWLVHFGFGGGSVHFSGKTSTNFVRAVRGGCVP
ncbi:MAG: hypothetical protein DMF83_27290 [Acidobacteria bacterium]|nr:MAG: hypothetical protein DMF83_27290 [Acidobacteriota bacterium]